MSNVLSHPYYQMLTVVKTSPQHQFLTEQFQDLAVLKEKVAHSIGTPVFTAASTTNLKEHDGKLTGLPYPFFMG